MNAALTEISGQPTLVVDGWTVIVTGTKETGIALRVLTPNNRKVENGAAWAQVDHRDASVAVGITCEPQKRQQVLAVDLDDTDLVLGAGREVYVVVPGADIYDRKVKVWQKTLHRSGCRHAKNATSMLVKSEAKDAIRKHGIQVPYRTPGHNPGFAQYVGCTVCGTVGIELVEGT